MTPRSRVLGRLRLPRWTATSCLLCLLALALSAPLSAAGKRPSSLQQPGALVRFTHRHERVARCTPRPDRHRCVEQLAAASAGTQLTLSPVAEPLVSEPTPPRAAMVVSLPDGVGSVHEELRIPKGAWSLTWQDQIAGLRVDDERGFAIGLSTLSGACVAEGTQCVPKPASSKHTVTIPPEFALAR